MILRNTGTFCDDIVQLLLLITPYTSIWRPWVFNINTNHPGGDLLNKTMKFDVVGERPATGYKKSQKIASPQFTVHILRSFPNGMEQTIWFSIHNFWFSHISG